jgi:hypothetical protein
VLLPLGLVVLALLVWAGVAGHQLRAHALAAAGHVGEVEAAVAGRDTAAALSAARAAAGETAQARHASSALPLRLLSHLPVTGPLLTDGRTLVEATDLAVGRGALPLLEVAARLGDPAQAGAGVAGAGLLADGRVDVAALAGSSSAVHAAAQALLTAREQVGALDPAAFPRQVRDEVEQVQRGIGALASGAETADAALAVLPAALGADGPRSYLVVFQNPAEARPTGGIVGTWALVGVDAGAVSLTETGSNDELADVAGSAAGLSAEQQALYGSTTVRVQNANLSPDFAVAGRLLAEMWVGLGRPAPDAVVAVDPQGMAPLLAGRGDIAVPGGPVISADTVVDVLLRRVYEQFADDNQGRKQYLATVVGTVFADALGGGAFTPEVLSGLVRAGREGHVLAWSSRAPEQAALLRAGLGGTLRSPAPGAVGVYFTNVDASKLDYYLGGALRTARGCEVAATGDEELVLELTNDAPEVVPEYVSNKLPGRAVTTHTTQVALYLPPGRGVASLGVDDAPVPFSAGTEAGWSWVRLDVDVPRGAAVRLRVQLTGDAPVTEVRTQPLVRPLGVDLAACG